MLVTNEHVKSIRKRIARIFYFFYFFKNDIECLDLISVKKLMYIIISFHIGGRVDSYVSRIHCGVSTANAKCININTLYCRSRVNFFFIEIESINGECF